MYIRNRLKGDETSTKEGRLFQLNRDKGSKNATHVKRWIYKTWWLATGNKSWVLVLKKGHVIGIVGKGNWSGAGKGIPALVDEFVELGWNDGWW